MICTWSWYARNLKIINWAKQWLASTLSTAALVFSIGLKPKNKSESSKNKEHFVTIQFVAHSNMLKQLQDVLCKSLPNALIIINPSTSKATMPTRPVGAQLSRIAGPNPLQTQYKHTRKRKHPNARKHIHLHAAVSYGGHWQFEVSWCWAQRQASLSAISQVASLQHSSPNRAYNLDFPRNSFWILCNDSCNGPCMVRASNRLTI